MSKPEIDINLDNSNPEDDKEINRNRFWHALSVGQKKVAILAGLIASLCVLGNFGYMGFSWTKTKIKTAIDTKNRRVDSLSRVQTHHSRKLDSVCKLIDTLADYEVINRYHVMITDSIIATTMTRVIIGGVMFMKDSKGKMYYYKNGLLYIVSRYKNNSIYYYIGDDGDTHWCN